MSAYNVLITGGSEGIGFGLAKRFAGSGSRVLITGRSLDKLHAALVCCPDLQVFQNDIGDAAQREQLAMHIKETMPQINMLINNAGIQRRVALASDEALWAERQAEIDILLSAPIHLNSLLIPLMISSGNSTTIVNVTSGGAYIPQVFAPVYSACKAALHSYTVSLRHSLSETKCRVVELIPPAVKTTLAGLVANHGVDTDVFCDSVFEVLTNSGATEIGFGPTAGMSVKINDKPFNEVFEASASRFPISKYNTNNPPLT